MNRIPFVAPTRMEPEAKQGNHPGFPSTWLRPDLWLEEKAESRPEKPAILFRERAISYMELWQRSVRLAAGLTRVGLRPGDRLACLSANHPAFLEAYFASSLLGSIFVPLNFRLAAEEVLFQIKDAEPSVLLLGETHEEFPESLFRNAETGPPAVFRIGTDRKSGLPRYEELLEDNPVPQAPRPRRAFSPEDPQMILYTSGTTGRPKGALLPFRKTLFNSLNAKGFFELNEQDRVLVPVPLFHSLGLNILSVPVLFQGGTVVLHERFDPAATLEAIARHRVTFTGAVPTIYKRLMDHGLQGHDLSSLRFGFTAGAPIPVPLIEAYHRRGVLLKQGFGQTETSILCCLDAGDAIRKAGSVGKPVLHAQVKVVDERLEEVAPGETGEIVARGPILMLGYWRRAEETRKAFQDGWLRTQDLAVRDEEGFLTLVGRTGDMYISGGENVYPEEIERVYRAHPDVEEIAVIGMPDPDLGEVGLAFVVLSGGRPLDEEALKGYARGKLSRYKVPRRFVRVHALPRTETGKVQKYRLRTPGSHLSSG
jgi:fatty-acyl-CoA synthase